MKFFILFITILIQTSTFGQSKILLKNGEQFQSTIIKVFPQALKLNSISGNQYIMYSVIDSIITNEKLVVTALKELDKYIDIEEKPDKYLLTFSKYRSNLIPKFSEILDDDDYHFVNITFSPLKWQSIYFDSSPSYKQKVSNSLNVGIEYWQSLSNTIATGLCIEYSKMSTNIKNNNSLDFDSWTWSNENVLLLANFRKELFRLSQFSFHFILNGGVLLSSQIYNMYYGNEWQKIYDNGSNLFFGSGVEVCYSFLNYQIFSDLRYSLVQNHSKHYSNYNQNGIYLLFGFGYRI